MSIIVIFHPCTIYHIPPRLAIVYIVYFGSSNRVLKGVLGSFVNKIVYLSCTKINLNQ